MSDIHFGMAQWQHSAWVDWLYPRTVPSAERLAQYAQFFSAVEVGSTFYTELQSEQILRWASQVPASFRFSFKAPQAVSHYLNDRSLNDILVDWQQFQALLRPISDQLGPTMLQFPKWVDERYLLTIQRLCETWELDSPLSVEVRHLNFFDRYGFEVELLRLLAQKNCNRVVMDSRPVFSTDAYCESLVDAQRKKPRVPCHPVASAMNPVVRFIGHPDLERNHKWLDQWANKLALWWQEGRSAVVFVHSSDNVAAPTLASWLDLKLDKLLPDYSPQLMLPTVHEQMGLI